MFLVNFIHGHWGLSALFSHHNTYCSYADTIMPQFLFAVGFAYRWTFLRRAALEGTSVAYRHAFVRNAKLLALGVFIYGILSGAFLGRDFLGTTFQTLTHIAVTSLWVMPVIGRGPGIRMAFMGASAVLFGLLSYSFYFEYSKHGAIDGGPLGFLSWTIPLLVGSLACDTMQRMRTLPSMGVHLGAGLVLMAFGYLISSFGRFAAYARGELGEIPLFAALPFVPPNGPIDMWTMNQQAGSLSYLVFSAGFSLLVLAAWQLASDVGRIRIPAFRTYGQNALAGYLTHYPVMALIWVVTPDGWPPLAYLGPIAAMFFLTWAIMRLYEHKGWYLKL